jgi:hypothetical protein
MRGKVIKRLLLLSTLLIAIILAMTLSSQPTQALPEYAAQTGEPCATCHVSPSGGGLRTPRGQAWVADGKSGTVPDLTQSLELLGVHLEIDESAYVTVPKAIPPAGSLNLKTGQAKALHDWLKNYEGN